MDETVTDLPLVVVGDGGPVETSVIEALEEVGIDDVEVLHADTDDEVFDVDAADGELDIEGFDADAVFAAGEPGLLALAAWERDSLPPVVPIAADADRYDVPVTAVGATVDALVNGTFETVPHPVIDVEVAGESAGSALFDVTLLTSEPARISEFAVGSPDGRLDTVRSDGVVTATPLGSAGYARAAGGPFLAPGTGLVTVPISPYAMHAKSWVLRPPMSLSVERDEAAVSLHLDSEVVRQVPPKTQVDVRVGRELSLVRPQTLGDP